MRKCESNHNCNPIAAVATTGSPHCHHRVSNPSTFPIPATAPPPFPESICSTVSVERSIYNVDPRPGYHLSHSTTDSESNLRTRAGGLTVSIRTIREQSFQLTATTFPLLFFSNVQMSKFSNVHNLNQIFFKCWQFWCLFTYYWSASREVCLHLTDNLRIGKILLKTGNYTDD